MWLIVLLVVIVVILAFIALRIDLGIAEIRRDINGQVANIIHVLDSHDRRNRE